MPVKKGNISRRGFIKTTGVVGLGSTLMPLSSVTPTHGISSTEEIDQTVVPTRPFGKTGVKVSIL